MAATPTKTQSILLGGAVAALASIVVSFVPVAGDCLSCLAFIGAGLVAVWHYAETHRLDVSGGSGAAMGAGAGAVAGLGYALIYLLLQLIGLIPSFSEVFVEAQQQLPPGQAEALEPFIGSAIIPVILAAFYLVLGVIFGAIGGTIGASVFGRGDDTPGRGSNGSDGSGGPRAPAGDRPQAGGPRARKPREEEPAQREPSAYGPPRGEEEREPAAPRQA